MSFLDNLLRFFATADLIGVTKAAATRGQVIHVPRDCGRSGRYVKALLNRHGAKVKDIFVLTGPNLLRIVVDDSNKAIRILNKAGIKRV